MTHIISIINFKGGVGKTTTSVALAEVFSSKMQKKVLVIDLDPQTNATIMLIGEDKWLKLNKQHYTLAQLFKDALSKSDPIFNLDDALQIGVSDVKEANSVDLLPSSLDLIDIQDTIVQIDRGKFGNNGPTEILRKAIRPKLEDYDLVIIDCPPNLGFITLNGLRISDGYIIPTIADHLSPYGIPQIIKRIREFADELTESITPFGIIVTKYETNKGVHRNVLKELKNNKNFPHVYDSIIRQGNKMADAAEFKLNEQTLIQKYGSGTSGPTQDYINLAIEIWSDLEQKG